MKLCIISLVHFIGYFFKLIRRQFGDLFVYFRPVLCHRIGPGLHKRRGRVLPLTVCTLKHNLQPGMAGCNFRDLSYKRRQRFSARSFIIRLRRCKYLITLLLECSKGIRKFFFNVPEIIGNFLWTELELF